VAIPEVRVKLLEAVSKPAEVIVPAPVVEMLPLVVIAPLEVNVPVPIVTVVVPLIRMVPPVVNVVVPLSVALVRVSPELLSPITVTLVKLTVDEGVKVQETPARPALIVVAVRVPRLRTPEESYEVIRDAM